MSLARGDQSLALAVSTSDMWCHQIAINFTPRIDGNAMYV